MTRQNKLTTQSIHPEFSAIPIFLGAGIAFLVISFFVFGVDAPHPEWGKFWMRRPLIITPLAGATGGAFYAFMNYQSSSGRSNKILAILMSIVVYFIGLWLGTVLGLDGTLGD